ncbi:uncharacterized protein [Lolium perenne]|uniref:uncharacterized protein n=1 Tax=Lolium perenne TaxID=4522 RepID=UPI003A99E138
MAELQTKEQFAEIMTAIRAQTEKLDGFNNKLETLEVKVASLEEVKPVLVDLALWKPRVDLTVGALQTDLGELRQSIDRLVINSAPPAPTAPAGAAPPPPPAGERRADLRTGDDERHGPAGRRVDIFTRGSVMGPHPQSTPAKGTLPCHTPESSSSVGFRDRDRERFGKTPRVDCPGFNGEGPLEWKIKCESYFRVCRVDQDLWIDTAVVYFTGEAALWLQWTNAHGVARDWDDFVSMVCAKFGRREFEQLLRQFSRLRQMGTVAEYAVQFNTAMNCLLAHHRSWDPLYFVTQFVDGLRADIRVVVMVQQPKDLDSAVSLALLQEEAMELTREATRVSSGHGPFPKAQTRTALPLPPPPVGRPPGLATPSSRVEDKRGVASNQMPSTDDKVRALRAYRRARGECFDCGEKWGRNHVCAATVPLHVVQELLCLLEGEMEPHSSPVDSRSELGMISAAALQGIEPPQTVRIKGVVQGQEVLMLVDSGSTHSFISEAIAARWSGVRQCKPMQVKVADGGTLRCDLEIPECKWQSQGTEFWTTLRLFPLGCYDIILGMDWLQSLGDMNVNWHKKQLFFHYQDRPVFLQGMVTDTTTCQKITAEELQTLNASNAICHVVQLSELKESEELVPYSQDIQSLLSEFEGLFAEPHGLPPRREFDHVISLLPGARPVNIRPYRYNPSQKDEIEKQIADMLKQGIIRFSTSPFASPILLVQKKDGTWRFCIDYRYLNAMTLKNIYPLPIIDELLDELSGAAWFTSLDLRAGYHQIRLAEGEEFKTVVSLDFVEGLPKSSGFTTILVVVDKLTKYAHFLPLSHPYTAAQVAQLYFDQVFRLHSMPAALISDRDKVFTSKFWQSLFRLSKTEMRMSTAYHPQTDGQTERVNQCLETYLRCFISTCPATWSKWLPLAEFWYNTAYHTAIKTSPFQALYGHAPRYLGITAESVPVTDLQLWLQERQLATTVLKQHLHRANNRMKQFADNKRSDRVFQVGDWVYLRLQPYIQTTLAMRANAKLAFRYFGPFQVEQKVGDRSYRLKLPDKSKLHPVFHVSLLRKGIPPEEVHEELPVIDDEHPPRHVPEQVLQRRQVQRRYKTKDQVLIQWSGLPASLATWENLAELKARFPRAPAWGQAAPEGGGNVMGLPTHDASSGPSPRPKRALKDNPRYSPEEWTT